MGDLYGKFCADRGCPNGPVDDTAWCALHRGGREPERARNLPITELVGRLLSVREQQSRDIPLADLIAECRLHPQSAPWQLLAERLIKDREVSHGE